MTLGQVVATVTTLVGLAGSVVGVWGHVERVRAERAAAALEMDLRREEARAAREAEASRENSGDAVRQLVGLLEACRAECGECRTGE